MPRDHSFIDRAASQICRVNTAQAERLPICEFESPGSRLPLLASVSVPQGLLRIAFAPFESKPQMASPLSDDWKQVVSLSLQELKRESKS